MPTKINDFTVHHCIFVIVDDECWLMKYIYFERVTPV